MEAAKANDTTIKDQIKMPKIVVMSLSDLTVMRLGGACLANALNEGKQTQVVSQDGIKETLFLPKLKL